MARQIDVDLASNLLAELFPLAEDDIAKKKVPDLPQEILSATEQLFVSKTQAYREALVGCALARILDSKVDVHFPSTEFGENAFSGRSLSEGAVTPFLRDREVPVSANPYLSSLRGGAKFIADSPPRIQRDKDAWIALVRLVDFVADSEPSLAREYLRFLLSQFVRLREASHIALKKIAKPNLEQLSQLIKGLLTVKSGGRIAAILATAMFQTLSDCHNLGWNVEFQGINVADKASGAVGDITIKKGSEIILGVEVTERAVSQSRVTATFKDKVSPGGIQDYLFVTTNEPDGDAVTAARNYTAVGHEMNFVPLAAWLRHNLASIGRECRTLFQSKVIDLLMPHGADLKVAWNDQMDAALGVKPVKKQA
ncbi:MAG: hypothetical protein BroJett014_06350 [Planctomycetota bacterium]|nr:MAG: hypothetical protein BroJett014_06350 [Planctomycetota bacterium]